jgi:hypothetical protein
VEQIFRKQSRQQLVKQKRKGNANCADTVNFGIRRNYVAQLCVDQK